MTDEKPDGWDNDVQVRNPDHDGRFAGEVTTDREIVTATWCATRNAYADLFACPALDQHVHYEVEYDGETGKVLTTAEEQAKRRIAASPDNVLWHDVTRDLLHSTRGSIGSSATYLRNDPAMIELLRRERARGAALVVGPVSSVLRNALHAVNNLGG